MIHYDAQVQGVAAGGEAVVFRLLADRGRLLEVPTAHAQRFAASFAAGAVGWLVLAEDGSFRFFRYADERLRRAPEHDEPSAQGRPPRMGWRIDDAEGGGQRIVRLRAGIVPGVNGDFAPDATSDASIALPPEFTHLCWQHGQEPEHVLRAFIADLAGLSSYAARPREDGFNDHGAQARETAAQWFCEVLAVAERRGSGRL